MEFFSTLNCPLMPVEDSGSGSLDNSDQSCDYKVLYQTFIACVAIEHLMVIVKMSLAAFIADDPSSIKDNQFMETYFAEKEAREYHAMLHRQSQRYSAQKTAATLTDASFGFSEPAEDDGEDEA